MTPIEDLNVDMQPKDLLQKVMDRYRIMYEADEENRRYGMEDMKFVNIPGAQWDENMKIERGKRPCYEFNKLRISGKRIINDMRANRPAGKVRAVEGGDVETAEIKEGLIRNIWNVSDGDTVIDYAAEYQVNAGMAAWRVDTEYSSTTAFDQDLFIRPIGNPFCLYCDPSAKDFLKRDAEDWILTERISKKAYESKYPKADKIDFETLGGFDDADWNDEDQVRIAEYWWKKPHIKELWKMQFPNEEEVKIVDSESDEGLAIAKDPAQSSLIIARREVQTSKIMHCIVSGQGVIEKPTEWAGSMFPFVMIYGEYVQIDGKTHWWGLPRFAKDAQRAYNVARTSISEKIAMQPKSKFWATAAQAEGLTDQWTRAHKENLPFQLYNADPKAPGPPQMMSESPVPAALIAESQISSDEIKAVTGIFDDSLGNKTDSQSGRAIYARQQQGEIATFNYQDNMAKGIKRTYELLLDLIPAIYDTERELRVLGSDGAEDYKKVNQVVFDNATGKTITINDMASGRYDVTVTVGPNFSTLRQEAAETYGQLAQQFPQIMEIAGDLVMKSMDLPYADDIAERIKTILPQPIQDMLGKDKQMPPEVMQAMAKVQQAMQQVQQHGQLVQAAAAELETDKSASEKQKAELKTELANIKAARAEFDAHVAQELLKLVQKESGLVVKDANLISKEANLSVKEAQMRDVDETTLTVTSLDNALASFMQIADNELQKIKQKTSEIEAKAGREPVDIQTRRDGGKLIADVQYSDGSKRSLKAVRDKGSLKILPDAEA